MSEKLSRRDVLRRSTGLGALVVLAPMACGKNQPSALRCTDVTGLSSADVQVRTALAYVDTSVEPGKTCSGCQQFIPGAPNACGTCKVVKGPVNPGGNCKSFVAKTS